MARNERTSAIIDGLLETAVLLGTTSLAVISPNLIQQLDTPTKKFFDAMDEHSRERELNRLMNYILREKLISEHYQHGIQLSSFAKRRLKKRQFQNLTIEKPTSWDRKWRIILFDIPEEKATKRSAFTGKIKSLGFQHLQQSVWLHPFPCKELIYYVAREYEVEKFVTYIETSDIDNEPYLIKRFSHVIK